MHNVLQRKTLLTLYLTILRPGFVNMSKTNSTLDKIAEVAIETVTFRTPIPTETVTSAKTSSTATTVNEVSSSKTESHGKEASVGTETAGSEEADKYSIAFVTVPSLEVGKTIGRGLVTNKLAACVNIVPQITSIYEWKGEVQEDSELLLMIKTRTSELDKLTKFVVEKHPYEVCEVISTLINNGNAPYLKWIGESVPGTTPRSNSNSSGCCSPSDSHN